MSHSRTSTVERRPLTCLCDGYCRCAGACYLACLVAPILTLLVVLFWGLGILLF